MVEQGRTRAAVVAAARRVGAETGVSPAVLLSVAIVETNAVPFAEFDGRLEPLVRFEGHIFDRLLSPAARATARGAGLASAKAGGVPNPLSQSARWRLIGRAGAIDRAAAYAATSWGLGQVMGLHWKTLGYGDPQALAAEARGSVEGQFRLMAAFLRIGDLHRRLERGAFADFARLYNGPAYRRNRYDAKIERAFATASDWLASGAAQPASPSVGSAPEAAAPPIAKAAKGWSKSGGGLSSVASWLFHRFSIPAPTRSFSTSTERSPASATTPPPSVSNPASSKS